MAARLRNVPNCRDGLGTENKTSQKIANPTIPILLMM
jgi:hypothetical protein